MRHELNVVIVDEEIRFRAVWPFVEQLSEVQGRGFQEVRLDFTDCPAAFSDGMVPLVAQVEAFRQQGMDITVSLPHNDRLERLFLNTNWAHFLAPKVFPFFETTAYSNNFSLHRFSTSREQTKVVNGLLDVVMKTLRLSRDVLQGLEWSFNEITDNVLNHAQADHGLAQANWYPQNNQVRFTVADAGIGILKSLSEGFPQLQNDTEAIGEAIKAGITRNPQFGQGNGLAGSLRIATLTGGQLSIASGRGLLAVSSDQSKRIWTQPGAAIQGTMVSATLASRPDFSMTDAFDFAPRRAEMFDIIDARYVDENDALFIKLREETLGFGSRSAGRQLRTKFLNLLDAVPDKPLTLDWSGVPVISSSFADEAIGKLFVELGPTAFSNRVKNIRMEALVRNLIDKAIIQRVTQTSQNSKTDGTNANDR